MASSPYSYTIQHPTTGTSVGVLPGETPEQAFARYNQMTFGTANPNLAGALQGVTVNPQNYPGSGVDVTLKAPQTGVKAFDPSLYNDPRGLLKMAQTTTPVTSAATIPGGLGYAATGYTKPAYTSNYPTKSPATPSISPTSYTPNPNVPSGVSGGFRLMMPDGTERIFNGITPELDAALQQGGKLLRADNTIANLIRLSGGGYLADSMPLNKFSGGDLLPGQAEALQTMGMSPLDVNMSGNTSDRINSLGTAAVNVGQGGAAALTTGVLPEYQGILDLFKQLAAQDSNIRNQLIPNQTGLTNEILNYINSIKDTGLTPEAKAAMTTQALETVPQQFQKTESDLATRLLRQNPNLPRGGEFLRGYGPLEAAKTATQADLLQKATLADQAALEKNRALALQGANASNSLTNILANTYDPARYTTGLLGGAGGLLNTTNSITSSQFQGLDTATKLTQIGAQLEPGSFKNMLIASLLAGAGAGGKDSLIAKGIGAGVDALKGIFGGGDPSASDTALSAIKNGVIPELPMGAIGGLGGAAAGAGGSFLGTIGGLLTNPITMGIGAVVGVGAMWLKSQAHWEANTMVQQFENPYHQQVLAPFVSEFTQAYASGQLTLDQANQAKAALLATWDEYQRKAKEYGQKGSDEKKVSDQSIANLKQVAIDPIIYMVDQAIDTLRTQAA